MRRTLRSIPADPCRTNRKAFALAILENVGSEVRGQAAQGDDPRRHGRHGDVDAFDDGRSPREEGLRIPLDAVGNERWETEAQIAGVVHLHDVSTGFKNPILLKPINLSGKHSLMFFFFYEL